MFCSYSASVSPKLLIGSIISNLCTPKKTAAKVYRRKLRRRGHMGFGNQNASQTALNSKSHLIAEYEVTNHNTDQGLLCQTADQTRDLLSMNVIEVVADKGYDSRTDLLECASNGIISNVPFKYNKTEWIFTIDYVPSK